MHKDIWQEHWKNKQLDPSSFEGIHRKKDGTLFPVDITDNFITHNNKVYCCAIIRNITKRKEQDRIARFSEFTIQNVGDSIFWVDSDSMIQNVNESAITKYGYSQEEFLNMSITNLYDGMTPDEFNKSWLRLKTEKQLVTETTHYNKNGKKVDVEVHSNFIQFEGREYSASLVRDITVRKRKEAALRGALLEIKELKEKLEAENNYLNEEIKLNYNVGDIITANKKYQHVLNKVEQVASTKSTVLIKGESGTDKELLARTIHQLSNRSNKAFIKFSCTNIPASIIESELFGHDKGAFPGALQTKMGKIELANGGTILIDEIADLPIQVQPKLLRAMDEGIYERIGSDTQIKVDVRIIASTKKNLTEEIASNRFREDLFFALNAFPIESIPLRERKEDIPLLVQYYAEKMGTKLGKPITNITKKVMDKLIKHHYPGNLLELQNLIEGGVITSINGKLNITELTKPTQIAPTRVFDSLATHERNYIIQILQHTNWRVSGEKGAAHILNMRPTTLFSKIKKYNIQRSISAQ